MTRLIQRSRDGDRRAADELMPLIYQKLRGLAARHMGYECSNHTLQATALVHEAYLRVTRNRREPWQNRAHFFGAAATAVRRILVEHARSRRAQRELSTEVDPRDVATTPSPRSDEHILAVDAALQRLGAVNAQQARMVELRFFAGMTTSEIAEALRVSPRTLARDWVLAKAWLARELRGRGIDH